MGVEETESQSITWSCYTASGWWSPCLNPDTLTAQSPQPLPCAAAAADSSLASVWPERRPERSVLGLNKRNLVPADRFRCWSSQWELNPFILPIGYCFLGILFLPRMALSFSLLLCPCFLFGIVASIVYCSEIGDILNVFLIKMEPFCCPLFEMP